jgi:hypothetical protein
MYVKMPPFRRLGETASPVCDRMAEHGYPVILAVTADEE